MTTDILSRIAAYKAEEVARGKAAEPLARLEARMAHVDAPRGFRQRLLQARRPRGLALIAELKRASPSRGVIRADYDPARLARAYERGGAACLSVLTDGPSFEGAASHLQEARAATALPCLRKDFLLDPWQVSESRAMGADAILVILAMAGDSLAAELMAEAGRLGMDALVEAHDEAEVGRAARLGATMIGINNRDLRTFTIDLEITERLAQHVPATALIVTESGIAGPSDADRLRAAGAGAMLVGESLMRRGDVAAAVRELVAPPQPIA